MFINYLKIAVRNLLRHKGYSLLNIAGLAIGMACCILILLYVRDELSYDRYNTKADRIYRVASDINFGGKHIQIAVAPAPLAEALVRDLPEVEGAVRFRTQGSFLARKEAGRNFKEDGVVFTDNSLFHIFTIPLLEGDARNALAAPYTIVLSKSTAEKYFGSQNAVGQSLVLDDKDVYKVTGVYEDIPQTSHFHFDMIASLVTLDESRGTMWTSNDFQTYFLLKQGASPAALEAKFPALIRKYLGPEVQQMFGSSFDELLAKGNSIRYFLQPLTDIHLHSDLEVEFEPNGSASSVYLFSAIAFFILLIACINFMNLATARSATRAKEVSIRKVLGSDRLRLMLQFLAESVFVTLMAMIVSIGLVELMVPSFNALSGKDVALHFFNDSSLLLLLGGMTLFVGVLAGSYPAFVLSAFTPLNTLKSRVQPGSASVRLRSVLVVFQFVASVALIAATLIIHSQLRYIQGKKLGFNKEQVIVIQDAYALGNSLNSFENDALRNPAVVDATVSSYLPVPSGRSDTNFWPEGESPGEHSVSMQIWTTDYGYLNTMGMELVRGRDFSKSFGSDSTAVILNERAVKLFGFADPIGKTIQTWAWDPRTGEPDTKRAIKYTIIGVARDFHFESMKDRIGALGIRLGRSSGLISFRFKTADVSGLIGFLRKEWEKFGPNQPFGYFFLDDRFAAMYKSEQRMGDIFNASALLAIFTACLGLYGLAAFTAQQRTKEIGIRKVLGASVPDLIALLTREFVPLVLLANLIAWPLAYYVMSQWLQEFAYRISIGLGSFVLAGAVALLIALLTVSYQAAKAATANPVDALKYE